MISFSRGVAGEQLNSVFRAGMASCSWTGRNGVQRAGRVTGPLLNLFDVGMALCIGAGLLSLFYARIGAGMVVGATAFCLPLYVYFVAPGPFRAVFRGEFSAPLGANFEGDGWSVAGIVVLASTGGFCAWNLLKAAGGALRSQRPRLKPATPADFRARLKACPDTSFIGFTAVVWCLDTNRAPNDVRGRPSLDWAIFY